LNECFPPAADILRYLWLYFDKKWLSSLSSTNDNKSTVVGIAATNVSNYFYPNDFSGKSSGDVNF
jgi:hypothetical protein